MSSRGMPIVHPKYKMVLSVGYAWAGIFNSCYAIHNGVVAFVFNNKLFVTPYSKATVQILNDQSFEKRAFLVPLSDGDYPKDAGLNMRWKKLMERV